MVVRRKSEGKGAVKLKLKKETLKDLDARRKAAKVKGGAVLAEYQLLRSAVCETAGCPAPVKP